jgi:succinyl-diaminopimelate desuccinylase
MKPDDVFSEIEQTKEEMTETLMQLVRIPAIAPENGGAGETERAERLTQILSGIGFDKIERYDADDERVPSKKRPNIIAYSYGHDADKRLWIVTHLDVVPAGEESLWTETKPFEPVIKDGRVYGRGTEDNTQSMVASIFAVKALKNLRIKPKRTVALCFVADEEQGSRLGIQYLIKQGLFKPTDLTVVPDAGSQDGSFIEIAEKTILWLKFTTLGKQAHASRPADGLNAHRVGINFATTLDKKLHKRYPAKDETFDPPESTFEPTKKEKNVDAVNIIPAEDVTCFDCRILPRYGLEEVLSSIHELAEDFEKRTRAKITIEILQKTVASEPTKPNAKIVVLLKEAIKKVRGVEPKAAGIGGGTCAAYFREAGVPAVVWSTVDETAHQPNEYAKIKNIVDDAKIFALLMIA